MAVGESSPTAGEVVGLSGAWIDRDLSWLEFNRRVLQEALDERKPLLERVKFLAIFSSNLDEFFMKRMALIRPPPDDASLAAQERASCSLPQMREMIVSMLDAAGGVLHATCCARGWPSTGSTSSAGTTDARSSGTRRRRCSTREISPVLTPLSLDAAHPFPFVSNLSTSWAFRLEDPVSGESVLVRVKVPRELPQWLRVRAGVSSPERVFVGLDQVIARQRREAVPGDGDREREPVPGLPRRGGRARRDDGLSKRALVERGGAAAPLRAGRAPRGAAERRSGDGGRARGSGSRLTPDDVYEMSALLDYTTLFEIAGLEIESLRDPPWTPLPPIGLEAGDGDIFSAIRGGDILLHQPYDSFYAGVERFIREAADDPLTVSIKMTVYRVGDDTPFVQSLIRAAEAGKQVACVIELNARFDEERNLHWSRELEKVGAHVMFGVSGLKTHSKTALVVRKEDGGMRCYAHIAHRQLPHPHGQAVRGRRAAHRRPGDHRRRRHAVPLPDRPVAHAVVPDAAGRADAHALAVRRARRARDREPRRPGRPARIVCKMNQLEDPEMCVLLSRASQAGVPVDLIVRGLCCLAPGRARADREHPHPLDRRPLPRALPHLPLRRRLRRSARGRVPDRLGRLDAPQPLGAGRGRRPDRRAAPARAAVGDPRDLPGRPAQRLGDAARRQLRPAPARPTRPPARRGRTRR